MSDRDFDQVKTYLEAVAVDLTVLLEGRLLIPKYQRAYAWDPEKVDVLFDDLKATFRKAFDGSLAVHDAAPHFFGPIMVAREDAADPVEIIDGQQRLATLCLLLAAIYEISPDDPRSDNLRERIRSHLIFPGRKPNARLPIVDTEEIYHYLITSLKDDASIRQQRRGEVLEVAKRDSASKKIALASNRLVERVGKMSNGDVDILERFTSVVLERSVLLRMTVTERGSAFRVFEGLNARGESLSQADLVKNKVLSMIKDSDIDVVWKKWDEASHLIEEAEWCKFVDFILMHHRVTRDSAMSLSGLYEDIANSLDLGTLDAGDYVDSMLRAAKAYYDAVEKNRHFKWLKRYVGAQYGALPLIAAAARGALGEAELDQVCKLSKIATIRLFSMGQRTSEKFAKDLAPVAKQYYDGTLPGLSEFSAGLLELSPDEDFVTAFGTLRPKTDKLAAFLCADIEWEVKGSSGVVPHEPNAAQHLEHTYPKTPGSDWEYMEDEYFSADFDSEASLRHIGNLCLLEREINSGIGNDAYSKKAIKYDESDLELPKHSYKKFLCVKPGCPGKEKWCHHSIGERGKFLAEEYALATWPLS